MEKILETIIIIIFCYFPITAQAEIKAIIEGSNDAKVKIIIFESLTCSHCANFHKKVYPSLKEEFIDKGNVSIEFRNFPLDMAAFNASKIAHCKNDGNSEILHHLFQNQDQWVKGNTIADLNKNLKNLNKSISKSEIRRLIKSNGVKINNIKISDEKFILEPKLFEKNGFIKLSLGKKKHFKIVN